MEHMEHGKRRDARLKLHKHTHTAVSPKLTHMKNLVL